MRLARAPVEVQVLGQERSRRSAARGCASSRWQQLAHRGVDDAGSRCGPRARRRAARRRRPTRGRGRASGLEARVVGVVAGGRGRRSRATRAGGRTRRPPVARARAALELARGDAAEVQVRRQLRRAAGEPVVALLVALEAAGEPGVERARGRRARRARKGLGASGSRPEAGRRPRRRRTGSASSRGAPCTVAALELLPRAVERGEDGVRLLPRPHVGDEVGPAAGAPRRPPRQRLLDPAVARASRTARRRRRSRRAVAPVSRASAGSSSLGRPVPDHEAAAALAQRLAQLGEAAEQEPRARRATGSARRAARVEHEDGHDAVELAVAAVQGGVVVDAQVAPEPDDPVGAPRSGYGRSGGT